MIFLYLLKLVFIIKKTVILHLEKIPNGITHTGISFNNKIKSQRYDFRAFNENKSCLTTNLDRQDPRIIFPNIYTDDFNSLMRKYLQSFFGERPYTIDIDVNLGTTYKRFDEIEEYSKIINKKYIFGIYDCRHYVNDFALWAGVGGIPIWRLSKYFPELDC